MPSDHLRPHPDVLSRRLGDAVVLVHLGTDRIHTLNGTAALIWEVLEANGDLAEIRRRLREEYEVPETTLETEVERFVTELEGLGLIRRDRD